MKRKPYDKRLPGLAFVLHPETGEKVIVCAGESGYYELDYQPDDSVEELNQSIGVSEEEAKCLLAGSMFGWRCPAAWIDGRPEVA